MTKLDAVPTGNPCWADVMSSDLSTTRAFYTQLFGWGDEEPNEAFGGYLNFTLDGQRIAGAFNSMGDGAPDVWGIYIAVTDAKATCDAVEAAGGTVISPAMEVGTLGTMAVFADVAGAVIGVWQPGEHTGFSAVAEPGAPGWFELHTREYEKSIEFYRAALGWDLHTMADEPGFRYTTLHEGEEQAAGIMDASAFLPEGVPNHWSVYFQVADADATVARAVELGGTVEMPPEDTPYGRLATLVDPTGARFKISGQPAS